MLVPLVELATLEHLRGLLIVLLVEDVLVSWRAPRLGPWHAGTAGIVEVIYLLGLVTAVFYHYFSIYFLFYS